MSSSDQEHRITYKAGITRTPSDFLCQDGELAECINLTTDNEELKPMVQPSAVIGCSISRKIAYIHKHDGDKRYIYYTYHTSPRGTYIDCSIHWAKEVQGTLQPQQQSFELHSNTVHLEITSIGKVLIISDRNGLHYYLWKENIYEDLGEMPYPDVNFFLVGTTGGSSQTRVAHSQSCVGIIKDDYTLETGAQEKYNDLVIGLYEKNRKSVAQKKAFCEPFFVRAAIELVDGTFTHISQPVLLYPSITDNSLLSVNNGTAYMTTRCCTLNYVNNTDLENWSDLIKGIAVFVTDGIDIYDLTVDQPVSTTAVTEIQNAIFSTASPTDSQYYSVSGSGVRDLKKRETSEIEEDIKSASIFYKIALIEKKGDGISHNIAEHINTHTLENLTTQKRLEYDDYYSRAKIVANTIFAYNSRLNIANVERGFFEGFDYFMPRDNQNSSIYTFFVTIKTDKGDITIKHEKNRTTQMQGKYFYYPDPRAKHVLIFKQTGNEGDGLGNCILNENLTEHPGLNGAYYFAGLPQQGDTESVVTGEDPSYDNSVTEKLSNYIVSSEVDNPWIFNASGYNKVSTGDILGVSTTTMALSQDQFGQTDLIIFTDSGIWGMQVDKTGLFTNIHAISRDVCINANSITQLDKAVIFVSKKGLMLIDENGVRCLSERVNGKSFNTNTLGGIATGTDWASVVSACQDGTSFIEYLCDDELEIAYDYNDSRVILINPTKDYAYAYNIADASISKIKLPAGIFNTINDYPDYLLQGDNYLYSLYNKQREEDINTRQLAFLLTRPMKLAGPVSKASLRQLKNVGLWDEGTVQTPLSCVKVKIYLSDDMRTWYEDNSRFGTAAKYYRLALFIKMLPSERLSGTIITTQDRRTNNFR